MNISPGMSVGRYTVERLLGRGGIAEVWSVRHQWFHTPHALKILHRSSPQLIQRLRQEGRVQASLDHPNLLRVRDVIQVDGRPALLMPIIDGPSLDTVLAAVRLTPAEILRLFRCIVEGLAFAHARGFVHRDLKPSNILLERADDGFQPRIADFGLVKAEGGVKTEAGEVFGTPAYAAPEQLQDASAADPQADLWSLGVMWVEALTGRRPFAGEGPVSLMQAHRSPPNLGDLTGGWRALAEALLQRDPRRRPAGCAEVLERLQALELQEAPRRRADDGPQARIPLPSLLLTDPTLEMPAPLLLPRRKDRFVGRQPDLAALDALLAGAGLVTMTGLGGVGKTRTALELAHQQEGGRWPGGIWWCELSDAATLEGVWGALAAALGITLDKSPAAQLAAAIQSRGRALFILDNFEQIASFAEQTVGDWLERAPSAAFLVTSRAPLQLPREALYPLDVLPQPDAVELFIERARRLSPGFDPRGEDRADVERLVALLDRLPLAIELAAAHSQTLAPAEILAQMSERFALLQSGSPDLPERQRSLRATLEWSWALLGSLEQAVLARCSVFEGGIALPAADAVISPDTPAWIEVVFEELVDRNLLVAHTEDGRPARMSMLVSVQQFARGKLLDPEPVEVRHGRFFARMGEPAFLRSLSLRTGAEVRRALREELDNLVAATRRAVRRGDPGVAALCAQAAARQLLLDGPVQEGLSLLEAVLAMPDLGHQRELSLLLTAAEASWEQGVSAPVEDYVERGLALALQLGDVGFEANFLRMRANRQHQLGRLEQAEADLLRSIQLARDLGDRDSEGRALSNFSLLLWQQDREAQALETIRRALQLAREMGDRLNEEGRLMRLGNYHKEKGRLQEAADCYQEVLPIVREQGSRARRCMHLANLGDLLRQLGQLEQADPHMTEAVALGRLVGNQRVLGICAGNLAILRRLQGRLPEAQALLEEALAIARALKDPSLVGLQLNTLGKLHSQQGAIGEAEACFREALALAREFDNSHTLLVRLVNLGETSVALDRPEQARSLLAEAWQVTQTSSNFRYTAYVAVENARLEVLQGDRAAAERWLSQADALLAGSTDEAQLALLASARAELLPPGP